MNKLGFIVGHPTQFESPFYQYVAKQFGDGSIRVYYFEYLSPAFKDAELGSLSYQTYGIEVLKGYEWYDVRKVNIYSIYKLLKQNRYVIVNGYADKFAILTLVIAKCLNVKVGLRMDTVLWNNTSRRKKTIKKILLSFINPIVDIFWITGTKTREYLEKFGIEGNKIKVFSYITDNEWFAEKSNLSKETKSSLRASLSIPEDARIILCVTKLIPRESPIDLINAFNIINSDNLGLLIIGDGEDKGSLESYVRAQLKISNVHFAGYVNYSDLPLYYAISDLFVHPSQNEPWGVSVQEAMACGLPVVASDYVGSGYDLIKEGVNGFMYKYGDIEMLAEKLNNALQLDMNIVKQTNKEVLKEWSYETTWKRINQHIEGLTIRRNA